MKKFAFYLPQFHEIVENNRWWGQGFTEWTHIKMAKPLYKGHKIQAPLNQNYYNLMDKSTIIWQTNLMKQYGIDGLVYYHYYFNGKLLMEKPAENLLAWKEIEQPFFFCWANHSFRNGKTILLEQTYGTQNEWEKHFQYLLPFFNDSRYIKKDGKPMLLLYDPNFEEKNNLISFFNQRCKEMGLKGICVIEAYTGWDWPKGLFNMRKEKQECDEYIFLSEPTFKISAYKKEKDLITRFMYKVWNFLVKNGYARYPLHYNGNALCLAQIKYEIKGKDIIHGFCFEWDNTPRHGRKGYIISPISKKIFFEYMDSIKDEEYIIFNAWNEWAEGMVLEPSDINGYKYLGWIKEWSIANDQRANEKNKKE